MSTASTHPPASSIVLEDLKEFQRRTVEYAFRRLYKDKDSTHRFLVADEVGLGKTMVARGVIAKAVEHLWHSVDRIDIVYVCSNADIARQNINRLRPDKSREFARATRATLLPVELRTMAAQRVNYISMTPGTSLEPRSGMGIVKERALLLHMLREHWDIPNGGGIRVFRGGASRDTFQWWAKEWMAEQEVDGDLHAGFLAELDRLESVDRIARKKSLRDRILTLAENDDRTEVFKTARREAIAELRGILGRTCIAALRPDLVILDEFQRFKHLLDPTDDTAKLAKTLFDYADNSEQKQEAVRVLLLSATPYKMYSLQHEQDTGDGDHYEDLIATYDFLVRHSPNDNRAMRRLLKDYRTALFHLDGGGLSDLARIKHEIEERLRRVMSRTERLAATSDRSGMLREMPSQARLHPEDVQHYVSMSKAAAALDHHNVVEYWKSAPYLLNFMDEYELKRSLKRAIDDGDSDPIAAALSPTSMLSWNDVSAYRQIDPMNARLRALLADTVERDMWRLLWLPPSLPYYQTSGPFANAGEHGLTKRLVFSSWKVVPKVIASILSHEAERRMISQSHSRDSEITIQNSPEGRKKIASLLRFTRADKRLTGMPVLGMIYPSAAIARSFDPAQLDRDTTSERALESAKRALEPLVAQTVSRWSSENEIDERWYWACPILMDLQEDPIATRRLWFHATLADIWSGETSSRRRPPEAEEEGAESHDEGAESEADSIDRESAWADHVRSAQDLLSQACRHAARPLGKPPKDLLDVMAKASLGNPAVAALRSLVRVLDSGCCDDPNVRLAAGRVAWRFRNLFNLPEVNALVRGRNSTEPYWLRVMEYAIDGCIQAVLDEYAHVVADSIGAHRLSTNDAADQIAEEMCKAIGLRTSVVGVDDIRVNARSRSITLTTQQMRARFAARFGQQKGEDRDDRDRAGHVRAAFNSPFWPFVLASTSVGQEGLDFHHYCHAIVHWNLPANPVDLEQREGRIHRFKGHAVRKNVAQQYGRRPDAPLTDLWRAAFDAAASEHADATSELKPYWVFTVPNGAVIERHVPTLPLSRDADRLTNLRSALALYRMVFGQPRQDELVKFLQTRLEPSAIPAVVDQLRINLEPPAALATPLPASSSMPAAEPPILKLTAATQASECDLFEVAAHVVLEHPKILPLGCTRKRQWAFAPITWPNQLPALSTGTNSQPTWWLAMWLSDLWDDTFGIYLAVSPMSDQPLRMKVIDRLLRDPDEFGLRRKDLVNKPGIPKQWVFLAYNTICPIQGHGMSAPDAAAKLADAIDTYATRFAGIGEAIEPLVSASRRRDVPTTRG
jgi:hypothetical protein